MRIRRHFSTGGRVARAWRHGVDRARTWLARRRRSESAPALAALALEDATPDTPVRRAWLSRFAGHRFAILAVGVFLVTVTGGYLIAVLFLFPAPIFAANRSVPHVIGMEREAAREALDALGLSVAEVDRVTHPEIANGDIVWQDPPAYVIVPEGTEVRLTVSAGPQRIPVPDIAGYDADNARLLLEAAGLVVGRVESAQAPTPANVAVNTRPPAGTTLLPGTAVTLVVSVGAATIRVPTVIGLELDSARVVFEEAGLALGTNYARHSNAVEPGQVFFQEPAAGTLSAPGTLVNVILASGNPQ